MRECQDLASIPALLGAGRDSPRARALGDFFAAGGKPCVVLCDERLYDPGWIGDDAGPGLGTGIHALLDREDVGTVVVLGGATGAPSSRREELIVNLAERRRDVLFVLEAAGRGLKAGLSAAPGALYALRPNVLSVAAEQVSVGELVGYLEASDWQPEARYRLGSCLPPAGTDREVLDELRRWRRHAGMRRAVDLGTRWLLFEASHPLLWRSVERDVRAFFGRLERWGFFAAGEASPPVHCGPHPGTGREGSDSSRLLLRIGLEHQAYLEG